MRVPSFVSSTENFHSSRTALKSFKKFFSSRLFALSSRLTSSFDIGALQRDYRTRDSMISVSQVSIFIEVSEPSSWRHIGGNGELGALNSRRASPGLARPIHRTAARPWGLS